MLIPLMRIARASVTTPAGLSAVTKIVVLVVSTLMTLIATRLVFQSAGPDTYAAMTLVASLFMLVPFADMGTGAALTNAIAESEDPTSDETVAATLVSCIRVVSIASVAIASAGLLFLFDWAARLVLGAPTYVMGDVGWAASVSICFFAAGLPLGLGQRLLLGMGLNHIAIRAQLVTPLATLITISLVAVLRLPDNCIIIAPGIANFLSNLTLLWLAGKRFGWASVGKAVTNALHVKRFEGARIRGAALPMVIILSGLALALQSDRLILAHVGGSRDVAEYSLGAQLYAPLWAVVSSAGLSMWPIFAKARAENRNASRMFHRSVVAFLALSVATAGAMILLGKPLTYILSDGQVFVSWATLGAFALLLVVQGSHLASGMFLSDEAGLKFQAWTVVMMLAINIPLSIALGGRYGTPGPVLASASAILAAQGVPCYLFSQRRLRSTIPAGVVAQ